MINPLQLKLLFSANVLHLFHQLCRLKLLKSQRICRRQHKNLILEQPLKILRQHWHPQLLFLCSLNNKIKMTAYSVATVNKIMNVLNSPQLSPGDRRYIHQIQWHCNRPNRSQRCFLSWGRTRSRSEPQPKYLHPRLRLHRQLLPCKPFWVQQKHSVGSLN